METILQQSESAFFLKISNLSILVELSKEHEIKLEMDVKCFLLYFWWCLDASGFWRATDIVIIDRFFCG